MNAPPDALLIVEDLPDTRQWLAAAAAAAFPSAQLHLAATAAEARAAFAARPALVLLDLGLPDAPGLAVLDALRTAMPEARCVITTIFDDDEHLFSALQRGACGYILKEQSREHLSEMLLAMQAGQPPLSPGVARRLLSHFQQPTLTLVTPPAANDHSLTGREREVLLLVAKGYSVPQAAKAMEVSHHTAQSHIKNVYRKLEVASRAEAVLAAQRMGLV
jgi:DNA-binding NarL/FixJ family response regulator